MNYRLIDKKVLEVIKECGVQSFPIDCTAILKHYQIKLLPYEYLQRENRELFEIAATYSDEAFQYEDIICFNSDRPSSRIRFSLMHELGHFKLNHGKDYTAESEKEANYFSSHLLAPRIAIYFSECKTSADVAKRFQLSQSASDYAFNDYRRWRRMSAYHLNAVDRELYLHFHSAEEGGFIWNIHTCRRCGHRIINRPEQVFCDLCQRSSSQDDRYFLPGIPDQTQRFPVEEWGFYHPKDFF